MIPIYKPYLPAKSLTYAHEALDSTWISSQGKYLQLVREKLQEILGVKHVLPVNNGTSACHLVAKALKRKYNLDEIIVPNNVYVAAINAFLFDNDWKLFTVECDENTWNYDLDVLDIAIKTHPNAGVLLVHNMGGIINQPVLQIKYPNTIFVEDACEAFMGKYENQYAGTASFVNAFSTFANKTVCSGEGGFITTNDKDTYTFMKCIHSQGQSNKRFIHNELGYNYRMTNVQASILYGQLEVLSEIIEKKNNIFMKYRSAFTDREDVFIQKQAANTQHANWMFGLRILNNKNFDAANEFFASRGIETRPMFYPLTEHKFLQTSGNIIIGDCRSAKILNEQIIVLPSYPELSGEEQIHIINTVEEYLREI